MNTHTSSTPLTGAWDDKQAIAYVEKWGELPLHSMIPSIAVLQPTDTVLDIGCGSGAAIRSIASQLTTGQAIGIDPTPKMLAIATTLSKDSQRTRFLTGCAESIPLDNASCDLVLAVNTFHHWQDVTQGLTEVYRVLKPGGKFIVIDDIWDNSPEYAEAMEVEHAKASGCEDATAKASQLSELKLTSIIMDHLKEALFTQLSHQEHLDADTAISIIISYKTHS